MKTKALRLFDILVFVVVISVHVWAVLKLPKPLNLQGWSQTLELMSETQFLSMLVIGLSVIGIVVLLCKQFHLPHSKWLSGIFLGLALASIPTSPIAQTLMLCIISGILKNLDQKTYNKFKNEEAASGSDASSTRPF